MFMYVYGNASVINMSVISDAFLLPGEYVQLRRGKSGNIFAIEAEKNDCVGIVNPFLHRDYTPGEYVDIYFNPAKIIIVKMNDEGEGLIIVNPSEEQRNAFNELKASVPSDVNFSNLFTNLYQMYTRGFRPDERFSTIISKEMIRLMEILVDDKIDQDKLFEPTNDAPVLYWSR